MQTRKDELVWYRAMRKIRKKQRHTLYPVFASETATGRAKMYY